MPALASFLLLLALLAQACPCFAPPFSKPDSGSENDPGKKSQLQLNQADAAFDNARGAYDAGNVEKGDAQLEAMTKALNACLSTLEAAHKERFYKKAELRVANLQRRMKTLLDDIALPQRGWAEQTSRELEVIHDKLLAGAMSR